MWSLHGLGERTFARGIWVIWPRWPPRPYMVKALRKSSSPEPKGQLPWALVCRGSGPSKFVQAMTFGWPGPILWQGQIWSLMLLYEKKTVRKLFDGRNLQQMTRVTWGICLHKNSDPTVLSAPAPGLCTCIKTNKMFIKSDFKEIFLKLTLNGQSDKVFLLTSKFCPQGVV